MNASTQPHSTYKCPNCGHTLSLPYAGATPARFGSVDARFVLAFLLGTVAEVSLALSGVKQVWALAVSVVVFMLVGWFAPSFTRQTHFHCSACHARGEYSSLPHSTPKHGDA
jgi:hypothetical protein